LLNNTRNKVVRNDEEGKLYVCMYVCIKKKKKQKKNYTQNTKRKLTMVAKDLENLKWENEVLELRFEKVRSLDISGHSDIR